MGPSAACPLGAGRIGGMSWPALLRVVAGCYGTVMALSPLFQIHRMRSMGSSRDVSLTSLGIMCLGGLVWALYGVSVGSVTIIVPNVTAILTFGAAVALALRLRRRSPAARAEQVAA